MGVLVSFISTIIAAAFGSLMAPAFIQFLNREENKQKQQLAYLEELYFLSLELKKYGSRLPAQTVMLLNILEKNEDISTLPPESKDPLGRIEILLDYHLTSVPNNLYDKIKTLHQEAIEMYRPIAELIGYKYKITNREPYNEKAFELSLSVSTACQKLSEEISVYTKREKNKINIESSKSFFLKKWFSNIISSQDDGKLNMIEEQEAPIKRTDVLQERVWAQDEKTVRLPQK